MIAALLAGRKTQTRRLLGTRNTLFDGRAWPRNLDFADCDTANAWIDNGPSPAGNAGPYLKVRWPYGKISGASGEAADETLVARLYPRTQPGDYLWVKERGWIWSEGPRYTPYCGNENHGQLYPADKHRTSIHCPRWASRLKLLVTDVRIERVQQISAADCVAEGCPGGHDSIPGYPFSATPYEQYWKLWESLHNKPDQRWADNPWIIATSFTVELRNIDDVPPTADP